MSDAPSIAVVLNRRHARAWRKTERGLSATVVETKSAEDGRRAALDAAQAGADCVLAAGGDGTVQSVVEGLLGAGADKNARPALGIVPLGHGNDLARALARDPLRALDVGRVSIDGSTRHFVNSLGIGLEGRVARSRWRTLPGGSGYTAAALCAVLFGRRSWQFEGRRDDEAFAMRGAVLSIGNGPSTGGGYHLTPDARPDDGHLDDCRIQATGRRRLLALMRLARRGAHAAESDVRIGRFRRLEVRATPGVPIHADGELLAAGAERIEVDLLPAAIRLRLPA